MKCKYVMSDNRERINAQEIASWFFKILKLFYLNVRGLVRHKPNISTVKVLIDQEL